MILNNQNSIIKDDFFQQYFVNKGKVIAIIIEKFKYKCYNMLYYDLEQGLMQRLNIESVRKIFSRIPTIETERLVLRAMRPSDAEDMFEYAHLEEVTRYLLWSPHPTLSHTREYLYYIGVRYRCGDFYEWAVTLRDSGKMIGTCGFARIDATNCSAELGYVLNPRYKGMNIATEAARAVIDFGFSVLSLNRIEARYMINNSASRRVMEKCGMSFEGVHRDALLVKGRYESVGYCSLLSSEYVKD